MNFFLFQPGVNISGVHRAGGMQTIVHTPHGIHTMEPGGMMSALHQPNQPPPPPAAASLTAVQPVTAAQPPTLQVRPPPTVVAQAQPNITYAKGITPAAKLQEPTLAPAGTVNLFTFLSL